MILPGGSLFYGCDVRGISRSESSVFILLGARPKINRDRRADEIPKLAA